MNRFYGVSQTAGMSGLAGRIVYERSEKCKGIRSKKAFYSELDGEPQ